MPSRRGRVKRLVDSGPVRLLVAVFTAAALIVGFTNDMYGLFGGEPEPPAAPSALDIERSSLLLAQEWPFQTAMALRPAYGETEAERIGWSAMLSIANTSATPMVVDDVETVFPLVRGYQLRRVERANSMTVFTGRGDWLEVNDIADDKARGDARFRRAQQLPLILQPGQRLIIEYEQEFEFWFDGKQARFDTAEREALVKAINLIVPMNMLDGHLQCPFGVPFDTVVRTKNGEIHKELRYVLLVQGCAVNTGGADADRMRTGDDPLGEGFPELPG
ncbi:hypothetical protein Cci01nite_14390 [Catellatospora citrea]|uniref:Uncharacterized protein n=1 Tax=Catellatospora citrea TaxID=53366 RepID=A0A8J3KFQ3_9ACTN|nr:hypothetical protein Cci01nite_14390 [Catellatospora citrea]